MIDNQIIMSSGILICVRFCNQPVRFCYNLYDRLARPENF